MEPARGFIALISAILISTILLGVAATLDEGIFFTRFDALAGEYERIARQFADSCIMASLPKLADDYAYQVQNDPAYDAVRGGAVIDLGTEYGRRADCVLESPTTTPPESGHARAFTVVGASSFGNSFARQRATVTVGDPLYATGRSDERIRATDWRAIP